MTVTKYGLERDLVDPVTFANDAPEEGVRAMLRAMFDNGGSKYPLATGYHEHARGWYVCRQLTGKDGKETMLVWQEHKPVLDELLTCEMTQEEWERMRDDWITQYAEDLAVECGSEEPESVRRDVAEIRWEDYCGQEGWAGRDERIIMRREKGIEP